mgnify:CR=1 FL=1
MKTRAIIVSALVILLAVFNQCKKDKDPGAPDIPPETTFIMDFSDFDTTQSSKAFYSKSVKGTDSTINNWIHAAGNVFAWNVIIIIGMAVPVGSFQAALAQNSEYLGDDEWQWSYSFTAGGSHTAELHAKLNGDEITWTMYIDDFKWYTGVSKVNARSGYWILYKSKLQPVEYIQIDWNRDPDNNTWDIKYTNIEDGNVEKGGYIKHGIVSGGSYDAFFDIYNKGQDNLTEIEWNRTTSDGRVKDENKFGDTEWHCWDTSLQDINCQ